jgi:hypothetical protein
MSDMLVATASGSASVVVPKKGWFVFGGEGNSLTRSQKLNHHDSQWELGPDLFQSRTVTGECLVQVNILKSNHVAFGNAQYYRRLSGLKYSDNKDVNLNLFNSFHS